MGNTQDAENYKPSKDKTWKAYCAIDVGAVSCGYAYSFDDIKHTWMNKNWADSLGYFSYRAPSAILYDRSGAAVAFGFEACQQYMSLSADDIKHYKFQYDGLLKVKHDDITSTMHNLGVTEYYGNFAGGDSATVNKGKAPSHFQQVELKGRCDIAVLLAKHCKQEIEDKYRGYKRTPDEFVWTILVPFTWGIEKKREFREAMEEDFRNHFIDGFRDNVYKLELVTSTDALWLASKEQVLEKLSSSKLLFKKDSKKEKAVVFIHSGGTETEISIHKKTTGAVPIEIVSLGQGGALINNLFEEYLAKSLKYDGIKFIQECKKDKFKVAWLDLALKFETARKAIHFSEESDISIDLNYGFSNAYFDITGKRLTEAMDEKDDRSRRTIVLSKNGKLILNGQLTSQMCTNVMQLILNKLNEVMNENGLRYQGILMTGGFGESIFAREFLCSKQKTKEMDPITLYTPENSTSLLTLGAIESAKRGNKLGHTVAIMYKANIQEDNRKPMERIFPVLVKGEPIEVGKMVKYGPLKCVPVDCDGSVHVNICYIPETLKIIKPSQCYLPKSYQSRVIVDKLTLDVPHREQSKLHAIYIEVTSDLTACKLTMILHTCYPKRQESVMCKYNAEIWETQEKQKHNKSKGKSPAEGGQERDPVSCDGNDNISDQAATGQFRVPSCTQSYSQATGHS